MKKAMAYANANIALVKYWGKNDAALNIPMVSSLSMTLDGLGTTVILSSNDDSHSATADDEVIGDRPLMRLCDYLETVRKLYPFDGFLNISSTSTIPMSAGLASSAAFFAALAHALNDFLQLDLDQTDLSRLARIGSASAARSIFGGYVGLFGGVHLDHHQAHAFSVNVDDNMDLALAIALVDDREKPLSSREAMKITKKTSPFFDAFVKNHDEDFRGALVAVQEGSFAKLGAIMEHSTLKMFATMWTSTPSINYWQPNSVALINLVYRLRKMHGDEVFFTMDAGPNVKLLCRREFLSELSESINRENVPVKILITKPGDASVSIVEKNL